jgi:tRNA threonylcarbamoyladenosine biosynthesis protein TsaB
MTILALDFSSPQRSVAVARSGRDWGGAVETGARGTNAFGMIGRALAEANIEREDIEALAVGLGPGSYTGIRAAIALAQGWQMARGVKLLGIGSAECLAVQAREEGIFGRVNVVIDARRNEFYLAAYEISADGCSIIEPLRIATFAEVRARAGAEEMLIGPEVTHWFPDGRTFFPRAATLVKLAADRNDFVAGEKLEPVYLRGTNFVKAPPRNPIAF